MPVFPSWQRVVQRAAAVLPVRLWEPEVVDYLTSLPASAPWAVACSGGADSVYLLLSLLAGFPEKGADMRVLHFDHHLRGEASRADREFVCAMAESLGLTFYYGVWQRQTQGQSNEASARAARHAFLRDQLRIFSGRVVFFGHQRDDIAEQMLMRLARGSGTAGLAAPRPVQAFRNRLVYLHPLLGLSRATIRNGLRALGVPWREDSSNETDAFLRNRIRRHVLPAWQSVSTHDVARGVAQARCLLDEDDQALEAWLDALLPQPPEASGWDISVLRSQPRALVRRALYRWLGIHRPAITLSRVTFERVLHAVIEDCSLRISVGFCVWIIHRAGRLTLLREAPARPWHAGILMLGAHLFLPSGACLSAILVRLSDQQREAIFQGEVDERREVWIALGVIDPAGFLVRPWKSGDRYRPLGGVGHTLLQDSFTGRKVDRVERRQLPVVCNRAGAILWCPYLPPAELGRIDRQSCWAEQETLRDR